MHLTGGKRHSVVVKPGQWKVVPESGQVTLSEQTLVSIINTDPFDQWYTVDPQPIASGQFAVVYHCRHRITGEEFAAKFASKRRLGVDASPSIIHEITVNAVLATCESTVKLQEVFVTDTEFILIMELASGGDLQTLVDENVVFYERHVISFLRQLLDGLVFIHDRNIVHLDIKPQNLVLMGEFPDCAVKLCDFEISRLLTAGFDVREIRGTPDYVAPEILHFEPITTKTDMWSLGVLTYVLLTGFLPFGGDSDQETFMQISWGELDFPTELFEDITSEAIDFIKKLLIREPEQRMSAQECLDHKWMQENTKETIEAELDEKINTHQTVTRAESSPPVISPLTEENVLASQIQGRPPLHPRTSQKSLYGVSGEITNTPILSVTPFLNKESRMGSKQNLNRLRAMSKSREVLSERVQMSNLKKNLSKSRERLFDARIDMNASHEDLMSLSQSVEALTALSQLHQNGALYKSCNNLFIPMMHLVNKRAIEQDRMYRSLAAIDTIPNMDLSKCQLYDNRYTSDDDFNDIITMRNTNMNTVITESSNGDQRHGGLRGYPCRGGRNAEGNDRICQRHKQPEAQSTQKIRKMSRSEKMKKDVQKRRKEKKEQETKERKRKLSLNEVSKSSLEGASPNTVRRGSVCHIEQRLQERHERKMEKQEKERKTSVGSPLNERKQSTSSTLAVEDGRPRSTTPSRKRRTSKSESSRGSDVSQASSLESVNGSLEDMTKNNRRQRRRSKYSPPPSSGLIKHTLNKEARKANDSTDNTVPNILKPTSNFDRQNSRDSDEAYASLEENSKDIIETMNINNDDERATENSLVTSLMNKLDLVEDTGAKSNLANEDKKERKRSQILADISDLHCIQEESVEHPKFIIRSPSSTSDTATSDIGSMISEESADQHIEEGPEIKHRNRSMSIQPRSVEDLCTKVRARSNSTQHQTSPVTDKARPWGDLCNGSIAKALRNFTIQENSDGTATIKDNQGRRLSSPPLP